MGRQSSELPDHRSRLLSRALTYAVQRATVFVPIDVDFVVERTVPFEPPAWFAVALLAAHLDWSAQRLS